MPAAAGRPTLRRLPLPAGVAGSLWLGPMPGRDDGWNAFLADARRAGIDRLVCLTPLFEIGGTTPAYLAAIQDGSLPFAWDHLPMRNFGLAMQADEFRTLVERIVDRLRAGDNVLIHCAAGVGRTGTTAACVLKALGRPTADALSEVRAAGSNPQSAVQSGLIDRF